MREPAALRPVPFAADGHSRKNLILTAGAFALALLCGTLLVYNAVLGAALIGALVFVPVAFFSPPLALSIWMASAFLTALPGMGQVSNRSLYLLFIVWVG